MLLVGTVLKGYCGGWFGRDSYEDKRVEAVGVDWVVVRDDSGYNKVPLFATGKNIHEELKKFIDHYLPNGGVSDPFDPEIPF